MRLFVNLKNSHWLYSRPSCTICQFGLFEDNANQQRTNGNYRGVYFWKQSGDLRGWWVWL